MSVVVGVVVVVVNVSFFLSFAEPFFNKTWQSTEVLSFTIMPSSKKYIFNVESWDRFYLEYHIFSCKFIQSIIGPYTCTSFREKIIIWMVKFRVFLLITTLVICVMIILSKLVYCLELLFTNICNFQTAFLIVFQSNQFKILP